MFEDDGSGRRRSDYDWFYLSIESNGSSSNIMLRLWFASLSHVFFFQTTLLKWFVSSLNYELCYALNTMLC